MDEHALNVPVQFKEKRKGSMEPSSNSDVEGSGQDPLASNVPPAYSNRFSYQEEEEEHGSMATEGIDTEPSSDMRNMVLEKPIQAIHEHRGDGNDTIFVDEEQDVSNDDMCNENPIQSPNDRLPFIDIADDDEKVQSRDSMDEEDSIDKMQDMTLGSIHSLDFKAEATELAFLPGLDLPIIEEAVFMWTLDSWKEASNHLRITSPYFEMGGNQWRVLLFPRGQSSTSLNVSAFIENLNALNSKPLWAVCAQFSISLKNEIRKDSTHRFTNYERDWGFTNFARPELFDSQSSISFCVAIRVVKDVEGGLWVRVGASGYDSRLETGHVGLRNQGATCYMNSLLQSLYFLPSFVRATYAVPTANAVDGVEYALQRLFCGLQTSKDAVATHALTKAFGWDSVDALMQRDVQEFARLLMESLEAKLKGCPAEGALDRLFMGKTKTTFRCLNVPYESGRTELFYDIQLPVKNLSGVEEALDAFTTVEMLTGSNQYHAEGFGLQDAELRIAFWELPPVLHFHLKRFEYDPIRDGIAKLNDHYTFPIRLDMTPYMSQGAPSFPPNQSPFYVLYGVLVHAGDLMGGHYYAFTRTLDGGWLRLDDDKVWIVPESAAVEDNFGFTSGTPNQGLDAPGRPLTRSALQRHVTNAYMLVYICESVILDLLSPLTLKDIPSHILEATRAEEKAELERFNTRRLLAEQQPVVILNSELLYPIADGVGALERLLKDDESIHTLPTLRMKRFDTIGDVRQRLFREHGVSLSHQRLWLVAPRPRPPYAYVIVGPLLTASGGDDDEAKRLGDLADRHGRLILYLELGYEEAPLCPITKDSLIVFVKFLDSKEHKLFFLGTILVRPSDMLSRVGTRIAELAELDPKLSLELYMEASGCRAVHLASHSVATATATTTVSDVRLVSGSVLVAQVSPAYLRVVAASSDDVSQHSLDTVSIYYDNVLRQRVELVFRPLPLSTIIESEEEPLSHTFLRTQPLSELTHTLAKALVSIHPSIRPDHLRLTLADPLTEVPRTESLGAADIAKKTIGDVLPRPFYTMANNSSSISSPWLFFYEVLDMPLSVMETLRSWKVHLRLSSSPNCVQTTSIINASFSATPIDLAMACGLPCESKKDFRVLEVIHHSIVRVYGSFDSLADVGEHSSLILERVPKDQRDTPFKLIRVFHYWPDWKHPHSLPFLFSLVPDEPLSVTRPRLFETAGLSPDSWDFVSLVRVSPLSPSPPPLTDMEENGSTATVLARLSWSSLDLLGLCHSPHASLSSNTMTMTTSLQEIQKKSSPAWTEKAMRIK